MSASGTKETCILEDPNAVRHMDALFDVLRKPKNSSRGRSVSNSRSSTANSAGGRSAASAAAELVCGGPTEYLLDALFAVVEPTDDRARGRGGGRGSRATAMTRGGAASAKSWKERKLPASFFDGGGGRGSPQPGKEEEVQEVAEDGELGSPIPSPDSESRQVPNSSSSSSRQPGLAQLPVVLVNTSSSESLTFYIE